MTDENEKQEKTKREQPSRHPFDQMMFGNRINEPSTTEQAKQEDETNKFDLFNTTQTIVETYQQLSPYVKGLSDMVKKYKPK